MQITFNIHYYTQWGQQLAIVGDVPELGADQLDRALLLQYKKDGHWEGRIHVSEDLEKINYKYILVDGAKGSLAEEWGASRILRLSDGDFHCWVKDYWRTSEEDQNVFYSSAFKNAIFKAGKFRRLAPKVIKKDEVIIRFQMDAPAVPPGMQLGVLGNIEELGNWNQTKPLLLDNVDHPRWTGEIQFPKYRVGNIAYKYCFYDKKTLRVELIEGGSNRSLNINTLFDKEMVKVTDQNFSLPKGPWKGAGMAVPVFSLRTKDSCGVGEFSDLKKMVDWADKCSMRMVQILPVNDTTATKTWTDSYPYAAISVFALHPILLHLDHLPGVDKTALKKAKTQLNKLDQVDYEAVMKEKITLAKQAFLSDVDGFLKDKAFKKYFRESKHWLEPFALFCYFRDQYNTPDFSKWGSHQKYSKTLLKKMAKPGSEAYEEMTFTYYLQFYLDQQLRAAADYARSKGIVLKGDLPIGIYRYSADAWVAPELYNMNGQAGAPPDPFSETGQNWGFPTYDWKTMAKDGYQWWKDRMIQLARYFDAYRIDHILGFFRIWEIPLDQVDGILGTFNPAIPIERSEFSQKGISFEFERYCRPFISDRILEDLFGEQTAMVKTQFLVAMAPGRYQFKAECSSQRKVLTFLDEHFTPELKEELKDKLFSLISNVLLIPDNNDPQTKFHPRIDMIKTTSYQNLDTISQGKLRELYYDYFYNRQESFWKDQAMEKLPALSKATDMLICGEDLGMVPDCVPGVMEELNILTLEIQRMSKNPATEFLNVNDIPYLSVASPSTHDMSPIRAWWEEAEWEQVQRFYEQELRMIGDHPFYCEPYIAQAIINQHLSWPSMWTVFPIQDLLAMDGRLRFDDPFAERINVPANPKHYWRYRMHLNLEQLIEENGFNNMLKAMLSSANRL